jgi:hypothetical protein
MNDTEFGEEFAKLIPLPPRRYRAMRLLLARQAALAAAGPRHQAYFRKYRARLIEDASEKIARSMHYVRYHKDRYHKLVADHRR